MLEPSDRRVYWEPLSPPPGYELDLAVATTYSLDLQALIMAAVPMAFGALDVEEDGLPDQVQALASLQRVARVADEAARAEETWPEQSGCLCD